MHLTSPSDVLIPIAQKANINVNPSNNIFIEKPLKKPTITDKVAIEKSTQPPKPTVVKKNLIEERSKLFKSSSSNSMLKEAPKEMPNLIHATSSSKQKAPQAKPRSITSNQDDQFLSSVKHKLSPVKPKVEATSSKGAENDGPIAPPRRKGLVVSSNKHNRVCKATN